VDRETLFRLAKLVETKDNVTAAHTWRVVLYTQALAEAMSFDQPTIRRMVRGAAVHDLGKIDVPSRILTKPGALTDREFEIIRQHPLLGYKRLITMGETDPIVLDLVRSHHERLDGSGYPDGLSGERIPESARLFAVVDSFDAMTSVRPYRRADESGNVDRAIEDLNRYAGSWYCEVAVRHFTRLFESGRLNWIHEHFNDARSLDGLDSPLDGGDVEIVTREWRDRSPGVNESRDAS